MNPTEYKEKIRKYSSKGELISLWEEIQKDQVKDWAGGMALEYLIIRAFELEEGVDVEYPYSVKMTVNINPNEPLMEQIDGMVFLVKYNLYFLIESKDYSSNINITPISKLGDQLARRPANIIGAVFSSKGFTYPALNQMVLTNRSKALLWESDDIDYCLRSSTFSAGMLKKYKHAVLTGFYDLPLNSKI